MQPIRLPGIELCEAYCILGPKKSFVSAGPCWGVQDRLLPTRQQVCLPLNFYRQRKRGICVRYAHCELRSLDRCRTSHTLSLGWALVRQPPLDPQPHTLGVVFMAVSICFPVDVFPCHANQALFSNYVTPGSCRSIFRARGFSHRISLVGDCTLSPASDTRLTLARRCLANLHQERREISASADTPVVLSVMVLPASENTEPRSTSHSFFYFLLINNNNFNFFKFYLILFIILNYWILFIIFNYLILNFYNDK